MKPTPDVTRNLARFVVDTNPEAIPQDVRREAIRSLVNWVGCAAGGSRHETVEIALAALKEVVGEGQAIVRLCEFFSRGGLRRFCHLFMWEGAMLSKGTPLYNRVAQTIDEFMAIDLTGVGLVSKLFAAARKHQPDPLCMTAAELIEASLRGKGGPALIATGFPEGGGIPETDGPVGAAMLARAMLLGLGAESVIVIDEDWEPVMRAACLGAGLRPMPFPASGVIETVDYLRPVYIRTVSKDAADCHAVCDDLLDRTKPRLLIAVERPGCNAKGVCHALGGRPLGVMSADLDYLFRNGKHRGLPSIGFGDGGNELGMGVIKQELLEFSPKAVDCGCPCHGGVAAETATDLIVVSSVSNWGVTGVVAALSALMQNPLLFHEPELEVRCIEMCAAAGAVDGMFEGPEPFVDGISSKEWEGLIRTLRATVERALGMSVNWKGEMGDWRQVK